MGTFRNGARSFLDASKEVCRFSRMAGFRTGLNTIIGTTEAGDLLAAFEPFCLAVDALIAADNFFNQADSVNDDGAGEDTTNPLGS